MNSRSQIGAQRALSHVQKDVDRAVPHFKGGGAHRIQMKPDLRIGDEDGMAAAESNVASHDWETRLLLTIEAATFHDHWPGSEVALDESHIRALKSSKFSSESSGE
jgi:hypothetical protein